MSYRVTAEDLATEEDPGFLVDVTTRINGRLHMVFSALYWDEAVAKAQSALDDGLQVEIEEWQRWA